MKVKESIPFAPNLVESMRSLGYSFETAIADLIDNSISANAKRIDLIMLPMDNPYLIILDDGWGMSNSELEEALRYGSKSPLESRLSTDLGRFGLGMKSASLSQCRKLTVVSKRNEEVSCYSWDIDYINEKQNWVLIEYLENEINKLPQIDKLLSKEHGTYLLLQNFDRVRASTKDLSSTLSSYLNNARDHLALVFHRFIDDGLKIVVNNDEIEQLDPFLKDNKGTQTMKEEYIPLGESKIRVRPYILPYMNKLTNEDKKKAGGAADLKNNQGFYIYRNKRLIIWGTWFRLYRKEELTKLARIEVDIPSELDYMWCVDIKKSSASLPDIIKERLYGCIEDSFFGSKRVHEFRGRKTISNDINYIWDRYEIRDKQVKYRINRDTPQIKLLVEQLEPKQITLLNNILDVIEDRIPSNQIYLDAANDVLDRQENQKELSIMVDEINEMLTTAEKLNIDKKALLESILKTEPYSSNEELKKIYSNEVNNNG